MFIKAVAENPERDDQRSGERGHSALELDNSLGQLWADLAEVTIAGQPVVISRSG